MSLTDVPLFGLWLLYDTPLVIALGCIVAGYGLKNRSLSVALIVLGAIGVVPAAWLFGTTTSYFWALHLEGRWTAAHPKTRAEIESYLSFYSIREIKPKDSLWGRAFRLKSDERMIQYRILWDSPLDVVYDGDGKIQAIFTSYE